MAENTENNLENMRIAKKAQDDLETLHLSKRDACKIVEENKNAFNHIIERADNLATKRFCEETLKKRVEEPFIWMDDFSKKIDEVLKNLDRKCLNGNQQEIRFVKRGINVNYEALLEIYFEKENIKNENQEDGRDLEKNDLILKVLQESLENFVKEMHECVKKIQKGMMEQREIDEEISHMKELKNNIKKLNDIQTKMLFVIMNQSITEEKFNIFILKKILEDENRIDVLFTEKEKEITEKKVKDFFYNKEKQKKLLKKREEILRRKIKMQQKWLEEK